MKTALVLLMVICSLSILSPAEEGIGLAFWRCGADAEDLVVRVVNSSYMVTFNVVATDLSPRDLAGVTRESRAKLCIEGDECVSTKASVHYTRSDNHQIAGDFTINLPDGKVLQDHFKVKVHLRECL